MVQAYLYSPYQPRKIFPTMWKSCGTRLISKLFCPKLDQRLVGLMTSLTYHFLQEVIDLNSLTLKPVNPVRSPVFLYRYEFLLL